MPFPVHLPNCMSEGNAPARKEFKAPHFEGLLRRLGHDRDNAGREYEKLRWKLIKFFEWNCCFPAEDLVDQTLDIVAQKINDEEINDVLAFARGVAKKIRQDSYKKTSKMVSIADLAHVENLFADPQHLEDEINERIDNQRRDKCLQHCIGRLPEEDYKLFLAYHDPKTNDARARQRLANSLGITVGALRVRMNRIRDRLEKCTRRCLALH